jgi:large subunit ribosomal protein L17
MHRHGYKGRKFGRERDQRRALLKGLADSLFKYESIETTLPKAKEVLPYAERLITKAKKGGLHNRRQIIAKLQTIETAHKLIDEIAPKLNGRTSGHLKVTRTTLRRGDNSQMATISFVDDLSAPAKPVESSKAKVTSTTPAKVEAKKPATDSKVQKPAKKQAVKKTEKK